MVTYNRQKPAKPWNTTLYSCNNQSFHYQALSPQCGTHLKKLNDIVIYKEIQKYFVFLPIAPYVCGKPQRRSKPLVISMIFSSVAG